MPTFAVISGNKVSNIIVADDKEVVESALGVKLVEFTAENPAGIGWDYDPITRTFTEPVVEETEELPNPEHTDVSGGSEVSDGPVGFNPSV